MLQKRAGPKIDVQSIRHSDNVICVLCLQKILSENLPGRSQSLLPLVVQNSGHYREVKTASRRETSVWWFQGGACWKNAWVQMSLVWSLPRDPLVESQPLRLNVCQFCFGNCSDDYSSIRKKKKRKSSYSMRRPKEGGQIPNWVQQPDSQGNTFSSSSGSHLKMIGSTWTTLSRRRQNSPMPWQWWTKSEDEKKRLGWGRGSRQACGFIRKWWLATVKATCKSTSCNNSDPSWKQRTGCVMMPWMTKCGHLNPPSLVRKQKFWKLCNTTLVQWYMMWFSAPTRLNSEFLEEGLIQQMCNVNFVLAAILSLLLGCCTHPKNLHIEIDEDWFEQVTGDKFTWKDGCWERFDQLLTNGNYNDDNGEDWEKENVL